MRSNTLPIFYETKNQLPSGGFLSDEAYKEARMCLPFIGTDAFIVEKKSKSFLLPYRKATPAQGLWGIGGGLKVGLTPLQAMIKAFYRETFLELPPERFIERADLMNLVMWSTEEIMNLHIPFFIELSSDEISIIEKKLDPKEYDSSQGLTRVNLEGINKAYSVGNISDGAVDVLRYYYQEFWK